MDKKITRTISVIISGLLIILGLFFLYQVLSPEISYRIDKTDEGALIEYLENEAVLDGNRLIIPSTGVDMEIGQDEKYFDYGGWIQSLNAKRVPNLIAVHRFGWSTLSSEQKIKQTLYHVNKLKEDDIVYIVWEGELHKYQVDETVEGRNNPPLGDEPILYTCKFVASSQRVFVILKYHNDPKETRNN